MRIFAAIGVLVLSALEPSVARAAASAPPFEVSVIVDGAALAEYPCRNRTYVEAREGRSFVLRVANPTLERVAVALSVDGRNVLDAKRTSASSAAKWILAPGQTIEIPGWQISGETARRFFFTAVRSSYAKWLGDTSNVGLIEAVFFGERRSAAIAQRLDREPISSESPAAGRSADTMEQSAGGELGAPREASPQALESRPKSSAMARQDRATGLKDSFAATGIGERTPFGVEWVAFEQQPTPLARIALRYEFRPELVKLGVLRPADDPYRRDMATGFAPEYAPDPYRSRAQ